MFEKGQINYSHNKENLLKLFPGVFRDPRLLEQFNHDFDDEIEQTERAVYEVTTKEGEIVGEGQWQINNSKSVKMIEVVGLPNTGKTTSLIDFLHGTKSFLYHPEPDELGKNIVRNTNILNDISGYDYLPQIQQSDRTYEDIKASFDLLLAYLQIYGNSRYHLFDRGVMDSKIVWPRTKLLDGSVIHPHYDSEQNMHFDIPFHNICHNLPVAWNIIICITSPEESMAREPHGSTTNIVNNRNTLEVLKQQYLRLYYECLQPNSNVNVLLLNMEGLSFEQSSELLQRKIEEEVYRQNQ